MKSTPDPQFRWMQCFVVHCIWLIFGPDMALLMALGISETAISGPTSDLMVLGISTSEVGFVAED